MKNPARANNPINNINKIGMIEAVRQAGLGCAGETRLDQPKPTDFK
jgi:hypothetical protein